MELPQKKKITSLCHITIRKGVKNSQKLIWLSFCYLSPTYNWKFPYCFCISRANAMISVCLCSLRISPRSV